MKGFWCCACDVGGGGNSAVVAVGGGGSGSSGVAATEAEGSATQLVSIIEGYDYGYQLPPVEKRKIDGGFRMTLLLLN